MKSFWAFYHVHESKNEYFSTLNPEAFSSSYGCAQEHIDACNSHAPAVAQRVFVL